MTAGTTGYSSRSPVVSQGQHGPGGIPLPLCAERPDIAPEYRGRSAGSKALNMVPTFRDPTPSYLGPE